MLIFLILAGVWAVYLGVSFDSALRSESGVPMTPMAHILQALALIVPIVVCGAIQYWKLTQGGVAGPRLWWGVIATAIGAPIAGLVLMLIVSFALFSKSP